MLDRLNRTAKLFRAELLELYNQVKWGDLPSALSSLDILIALYWGQIGNTPIFKHRPLEPAWEDRDYFVLSKTQALLSFYYVLAKRGYFEEDELQKTIYKNPFLPYLPDLKTPGTNAASRIPGQGLNLTAGIAFQLKRNNKKNHCFCLIGDSEIQSGQFWESLMLIQQYQLKNLTILIDYNQLQMSSPLRNSINYLPLGEKISRFGIRVIPIANGHDFKELITTIEKAKNSLKPCALIIHTTKGKGISFLENRSNYSYQTFSTNELTIAQNELS